MRNKRQILQIFWTFLLTILAVTLAWPLKRSIENRLASLRDYSISRIHDAIGMDFSYGSLSPSVLSYLRIKDFQIIDDRGRFEFDSSRMSIFLSRMAFRDPIPEIQRIRLSHGNLHLDLDSFEQGAGFDKQKILALIESFEEVELRDFNITLTQGDLFLDVHIDRLILQRKEDDYALRLSGNLDVISNSQGVLSEGSLNIRSNGTISRDFESFSINNHFDQIVTNAMDIQEQRFQLSFNDGSLGIRKIKDRQPLDLDIQYHFPTSEVQFRWESEDFEPSSLVELKNNLAVFNPWLDTAVSGTAQVIYNIKEGDLQYEFNAHVSTSNTIITQYIPDETRVSAIFSGDNQRIDIEHFHADTSLADLEYQGSIDLNQNVPYGILRLENLYIRDRIPLSTTLEIGLEDDFIDIISNDLRIGNHEPGNLHVVLEPIWDERSIYISSMIEKEGSRIFFDGDVLFQEELKVRSWFDITDLEVYPVLELLGESSSLDTLKDFFPSPALQANGSFIWSDGRPYLDVSTIEISDHLLGQSPLVCSLSLEEDRFSLDNIEVNVNDHLFEGIAQGEFNNGVFQSKLLWDYGNYSYDWDVLYSRQNLLRIEGNHELHVLVDFLTPGYGILEVQCEDLPIDLQEGDLMVSLDSQAMRTSNSTYLELNQCDMKFETDDGFVGQWRMKGILEDSFLQLYQMEWLDSHGLLSGQGNIQIKDLQGPSLWAWFQLGSPENENIVINGQMDSLDQISGVLDWGRFNLGRIPNLEIAGSSSGILALERTSQGMEIQGKIEANIIRDDSSFSFSTELVFQDDQLNVSNAFVESPWANLHDMTAVLDLPSERLLLTGSATGTLGSSEWSSGLTLDCSLENLGNPQEISLKGKALTDPLMFNQEVLAPSLLFQVERNEERMVLSHEDPSIFFMDYRPVSRRIRGNTAKLLPISCAINGTLGEQLNINVSDIQTDIQWINRIVPRDRFDRPFVEFLQGSFYGDIRVQGERQNPLFYGHLEGREITVDTLFSYREIAPTSMDIYLQGDRIDIRPFQLAFRDEGIINAQGALFLEYGEISLFEVNAELISQKGEDGGIQCIYPIAGLNLDGMAEGTFSYSRDAVNNTIKGDFTFNRLNISLGQKAPGNPNRSNNPNRQTIVELNFVTGKAVRFVLPNEELTFLEAQAASGQEIGLILRRQEDFLSFQGNLEIESGEIFYFNRSFILNEGNILFDESKNDFNPTMAVEAELLTQDNQGEDVRIVLKYRGSLFESFEPQILSDPVRSQSEILAMLGQPIGTGSGDDRELISSIVMATSSVVGQYGLILPFENALKEAFNMDRVAVDTDILENILMDKLSLQGVYSEGNNQYNLWTYLDGTRLDMGKYLAEKLYANGAIILDVDPLRGDYALGGINFQLDFSFEMATPFFDIGWSFTPDQWDNTNSDELIISDTAISLEFHL